MARAKSAARRPVKSEAGKQAKVVVEQSETTPIYYVNNTQIQTSYWDVGMHLSVTVGVDQESNTTLVRPLAHIRMSHQHARVIVDILTQQLEEYEKHHGPIPSRPNAGP